MSTFRTALGAIAIACLTSTALGATGLAATPAPAPSWIGTWGYVTAPLPAGALRRRSPRPRRPPPRFPWARSPRPRPPGRR
ncbi:MAG: hypothetical protein WDN45_00865 [Caulobacteraceae bacterium]